MHSQSRQDQSKHHLPHPSLTSGPAPASIPPLPHVITSDYESYAYTSRSPFTTLNHLDLRNSRNISLNNNNIKCINFKNNGKIRNRNRNRNNSNNIIFPQFSQQSWQRLRVGHWHRYLCIFSYSKTICFSI